MGNMSVRLFVAFVLAVAAPLFGQVEQWQADRLRKTAVAAIEKDHIPALSVAVRAGGGPVWAEAWGFADLENYVPASAETVFRIGSISKPLAGVAAMQLAEQGRLDLDAEIQDYLPEFPRKQWPVTVRLLLCHQAGIRNYQGDEFNSAHHYGGVRESLAIFAQDPLLYEPGTKFLYTTYGFNLAGAVLEAAAGTPFAEMIQRTILVPSGAAAMRPDDVYRVIPHRARGYRKRADGEIENCALADTSNKLPGGGWVATAADLVKFAQALMEGKLLRRESLETIWTPQLLKSGGRTGYGLGWGIGRRGDVFVAEHSGAQQGIRSHLLLAPDRKIAIAVLTNLESADAPDIARRVLDVLLGEPR